MDFYAPNTENEVVYIEFIEKTINAQLPDHLNDLQLFNLVKTFQADATSKSAGNTTRMNVASPMVYILLRRQLLPNY